MKLAYINIVLDKKCSGCYKKCDFGFGQGVMVGDGG
jgi:hypothetical protein